MTQQRSAMLESFMQRFSAALGACSGLLIGISKEGVDLLSSLRSAQGWKEIYTGTSPARSKKIDNGNVASAFSRQPPKSGQDEIKQFLGTRPPELKSPPPTKAYSNAPILGGQTAAPVPASASAPVPFALPAGATSRPVLGDPLPDIFGSSTSFLGSRPVSPPAVAPAFTTAAVPDASSPAATPTASDAPPSRSPAVNGSSTGPGSEELHAEDDGASTADEGGSPEAKASTDSKMKKLRKRLSSKLKR